MGGEGLVCKVLWGKEKTEKKLGKLLGAMDRGRGRKGK